MTSEVCVFITYILYVKCEFTFNGYHVISIFDTIQIYMYLFIVSDKKTKDGFVCNFIVS